VRADRTQNTNLFWALRGGGGGLGVVVAMEIVLYPVEELVGLFLTQLLPSSSYPVRREMKALTYQALVD